MMAKWKANKLLALLLCLVMVVGLLPTVAFAERTAAAQEVQNMIDALPDADDITDENVVEVITKIMHIEKRLPILSKEEQDTLDFTKFDAAADKVNALTLGETETGSLTISKMVTGEGADASQEFEFTVTLNDSDGANISGAFGNYTFTNGVAAVKLKGGESATISGIPAGYIYTVTEAAVDHYTAISTGATGAIVANATSRAEFTNTYSAPPVQNEFSFKIQKTVEQTGDIAPGETTFHFVVATTWNNPTSDQILAKPTVTLTGKGTSSASVNVKTASNEIYIWEANDGADGWSYSDKLYKILKWDTVTYYYYCNPSTGKPMGYNMEEHFSFTNQYSKSVEKGGVTIQKSVVGNLAPEENGEAVNYWFNLKLLDEDGNAAAGKVSHQKTGGSKMSQEISTAGFDFSLQEDESITFSDIPAGTKVKVEETSAGDFTTSVFVGTEIIRNTSSYVYTVEGNKTRSVQFSNNYGDKTGSLTVSKTVSGPFADRKKAFSFTAYVYDGDAPLEGTYGDMVFDEKGKATFTLTDGQSVKATGLPVGYSYYVEETDNKGYTVTAKVNGEPYDIGEESGVEGVIESDNLDVVVAFNNNRFALEETNTPVPSAAPTPSATPDKSLVDVPKTGDEGDMGLGIALILAFLSLSSMAALTFDRKRSTARRSR